LSVPIGTEPEMLLNALKNWSNPFFDGDDDSSVMVDPDSIDVGDHIVREFVGEANFTTPDDMTELSKDNFTDLVSFKLSLIRFKLLRQISGLSWLSNILILKKV